MAGSEISLPLLLLVPLAWFHLAVAIKVPLGPLMSLFLAIVKSGDEKICLWLGLICCLSGARDRS
jgi:hypothetical protein